MTFYMVTYKPISKSTKKALVKARNEEEAKLMFNNPNEIGKTAEIKEVKIAKRIPKGWHVTFEKTNGFPITGKTTKDINFEETPEFTLIIGGKRKAKVHIDEVIGAYKPERTHVMKKGIMF